MSSEKEMQAAANRIAESLVEEEWKRSMGNPSDPSVTWMDQCAWHAMQGLLATDANHNFYRDGLHCATLAYDIATAMLYEKRKREAGGAS